MFFGAVDEYGQLLSPKSHFKKDMFTIIHNYQIRIGELLHKHVFISGLSIPLFHL